MGLAKPHPFPERLAFDDTVELFLTGNPTLDDWRVHDRWFNQSCRHAGYIAEESLGNIRATAHVRELLRSLQGEPTPPCPIMSGKVVDNGVAAGDHLPSDVSAELLEEVEAANRFPNTWDVWDRDFFASLRRLCQASRETRNPIVF